MIKNNEMLYEIVFCDIDGTLLDSNNQISKNLIRKVKQLNQNSIPFILVSARMPSGILPLQTELGINAPIVCYSGAMILDAHGACIKSAGIDLELAIIINDFINNNWSHISCSAYAGFLWIVDDIHDRWVAQEHLITSSVPTQGCISELVPSGGSVHKFLCMGEPNEIAALEEVLIQKYPSLNVYRSKDTYLEIMNHSASKSSAVKYICDTLGIPVQASVSFGDNFNDVDMLLATGTCFAMGNAPDAVKQQAKNITPDNDHDGVFVGLSKLNFVNNPL